MHKFSSFVFNKVVWWHESCEVENVYISYNFSIYLKTIINSDGNFTKFWQK